MQMGSELKDLLKTPEDEWYDGKITRHDHFSDLKDIDVALDSVPEQFKVEDRRRYTESCFGHFLRMDRGMKFSGSVVHRLLLRELYHDGPHDEMRFMLGPRSVRFSKVEFCLITGLKFGVILDTTRYEMVQNGIHQQYFNGVAEVDYEQLRSILWIGVFEEQYDAVKLCLLYMLNWILMGLDEREKVPLRQIRLVEDLDAFDAFPYLRMRLSPSLGPDLGLVGGLSCPPMFTRTTLVPTAAERVARYYEGINQGGSLYMATDGHDGLVPDPLHHTTAGPSHTEGSDQEFGGGSPLRHRPDTEGSDLEFIARSPLRRRQVRFAMPGGVHSREDVGGHRQSDREWDRQHREVMDFLRGRWGSTSQSGRDSPPSHDRDSPRRDRDGGTDPATGPMTEADGPQTQGPIARDTVRDQQMQVPGGTDTEVFGETVTQAILKYPLLMEVQDVDPPVHIQDHTADPFSPLG
ncbi:hypothetical protein Dsin_017066 [Dipteronia sinensis]|uniref:DUF1985 domain-containing protein n=1 Tax=Dipteronia sinensis TaxID=43782 RepID=A0AAE0E6L2_9ROSI|nr:hypothetical protein Dsin_017066 [Dipteronia sinensis]